MGLAHVSVQTGGCGSREVESEKYLKDKEQIIEMASLEKGVFQAEQCRLLGLVLSSDTRLLLGSRRGFLTSLAGLEHVQ